MCLNGEWIRRTKEMIEIVEDRDRDGDRDGDIYVRTC